jgi:hypothetical protein
MVFKLASDDALILCSSARCVHRLLSQGWRLADRSQTEDFLQALEDEDAEPAGTNNMLEGPGVPPP